MNRKTIYSITSFAVLALLLTACGKSGTNADRADSFATALSPTTPPSNSARVEPVTVSSNTAEADPAKEEKQPAATESVQAPADSKQSAKSPAPAETDATSTDNQSVNQASTVIKESNTAPSAEPSSKPSSSNKTVEQIAKTDTPLKSNSTSLKQEWSHSLAWSEFFDNEEQNTPSNKFWDLQGEEITIKGYMGEVLSFDKNWFLLIPAPGAECPFDNGDETYWNKIMMVFVPSDSKLRYTSKPIELKGTLDVGIKIDESGYKTMFRIYDAEIAEITE